EGEAVDEVPLLGLGHGGRRDEVDPPVHPRQLLGEEGELLAPVRREVVEGVPGHQGVGSAAALAPSPAGWRWRFSSTISAETSAGLTPEMREACPSVSGRILESFSRASIVMAVTAS